MNIESFLYSISLAPKLATIIKEKTGHYDAEKKEKTDDVVANTVAHAILGAVVAQLQGNSALAGGLGAAYGENSARIIAGILYPDKAIDKLSQEEKQQVSALAQLATGLTTAALGGDAQDINTAMAGGKNAIENNFAAILTPAGPVVIPVIPGVNNDKINEEIALAIERALKNIGKSINDFINDKGEIDIEEVKAVLSPEEQKILNEKIEIATNTRPKINNINDYLKNNEFGQLLSKGLVFLGYDIHGDPIFKMEGAGAGNFVNEGDKISFRKDGIEVYDKNGTLISVLNIDGTRNTTLSDMASGRYLATMADKGLAQFGKQTYGDRIYAESKDNNNNTLEEASGAIAAGGAPGLPPDDDKKDQEKDSSKGNRDPKDRIQHEDYKDDLRAKMEKPDVKDSELKNIMDDLYRPNAKIGSGSTADAVRYEAATGQNVGGKLHLEKAKNYVKALESWLKRNPTASSADRAAAENVLRDLQNALRGK